jgi:hypothetical protein
VRSDVSDHVGVREPLPERLASERLEIAAGEMSEEAAVTEEAAKLEPVDGRSEWRSAGRDEEPIRQVASGIEQAADPEAPRGAGDPAEHSQAVHRAASLRAYGPKRLEAAENGGLQVGASGRGGCYEQPVFVPQSRHV